MYLTVTFLSFNLVNWWWVWAMLELMNWSFMLFVKNFNLMIMLLMWQTLSSLIFLLSFLIFKNKVLIFMSMLLKMSLPPFHIWFWSILNMWNWKALIIFLHMHKYPSMMILINYLSMSITQLLIFIPIITFMNFWVNSSLKSFIWIMSVNDSCWLIFSYHTMMNLVMLYLVMNLFMMMSLIFYENKNKIKMNMIFYMILMMMALPPFVSFQLKWLILSELSLNFMLFLIINMFSFFFLTIWMIFKITILNNSEMYASELFLWSLIFMMTMWTIFL